MTFQNLASQEYHKHLDEKVKKELQEAEIPILTLPASYINDEVKTKYLGLLNGFIFVRQWRYWACIGDMPLHYALDIYEKFPEHAIRAEGHAGNICPKGYNPIYDRACREAMEKITDGNCPTAILIQKLEEIVDDPTQPRFVQSYHFDMPVGLKTFANYIKEHNIYAANGNSDSYEASVYRTKEE